MAERKAWTKEEDQALLNIVQVRSIKKWSAVSKLMETLFNISGRTGKQCRQRWHNQLDPTIKADQWTLQEQLILFQNHNKFGNRWARISQQLQGRTDNCVKNHFYSTLRRAFRRLNRFVVESKHKLGLKQIKAIVLSKLVAAAEDKFNLKLKLQPSIIQKANELKNRLFPFAKQGQNTPQDQLKLQTLAKQLIDFSKSYKRKKAKKCKYSEDQEDDFGCEEELSMKEELQKQQTPASVNLIILPDSTYQKQNNIQHQNLFTFTSTQVLKETNDKQCKQSSGRFELYRRVSSKIQQQPLEQENTLLKKSSNISNWSNLIKLPSFREKVSELSLNRLNSDFLALDSSFKFKNLFGCDLQQLQ